MIIFYKNPINNLKINELQLIKKVYLYFSNIKKLEIRDNKPKKGCLYGFFY